LRRVVAVFVLGCCLAEAAGIEGCAGGTGGTGAKALRVHEQAVTAAAQFPSGWPLARGTKTAESRRGMIVTDAALATKVGADVLASGGNAVDAAVAAAVAMAVVFPTAGNIGGGGFLVARAAGASYALDFRETAPAAATRDMYLGADGKSTADARTGGDRSEFREA
jgi:gamma-glutamyltranspeptidase